MISANATKYNTHPSINRRAYSGKDMTKPQKEEFLKKAWALYRNGMAIKDIADKLDKPYQITCKILKAAVEDYKKERLVDMENFLTDQMVRLEKISADLQDAWDTAVKMNKKPDDKYMVAIMKSLEDQRKIMGLDKGALTFSKEGQGEVKKTEEEVIKSINNIIMSAIERTSTNTSKTIQ